MPEEMKKDVDRVYQGLQHLHIEPTKANLAILMDAMQTMENVYRYLDSIKVVEPEKAEQVGEGDA